MRRMRTGRDAAPAGSASSAEPPGASGDTARPNYVGPSGQPGWWGRMNAGESPRNQGRSVWPPLSVSRRRSRGLRKLPRRGADRRAGPRYGPAVPSRWRDGLCRKASQRCGDPHSACRRFAPSDGGHSPKAAGRPLPRSDGAHPIERQARSTRAVPYPQPDNHETTESILAERTRDHQHLSPFRDYPPSPRVIAGLDPAIHDEAQRVTSVRPYPLHGLMDARVIGERSDAVLRTAMPAHDAECVGGPV
jgi:hypothetical protein